MTRPAIKYPVAALVGAKCGRRSYAYRVVYALEQWASRHGYSGHREHRVPTKADRRKQQKILFKD
jgi:hypothetical protein